MLLFSQSSRTCVLCGWLFSSQLVRELHTLRWKVEGGTSQECQRCLDRFEDADEKEAHWCKVRITTANRVDSGKKIACSSSRCLLPRAAAASRPIPVLLAAATVISVPRKTC